MAEVGLVLDMVGVVLVGWVVPMGSVGVVGGAPRPKTTWAKVAHHVGWLLLLAGFGLQLGA